MPGTETKMSPSLQVGYVCWGIYFQHYPGSSQLGFSLYFMPVRAQRFLRSFLSICPVPGHMCGLLDSQEYVGAFQSPYSQKHFVPQPFFSSASVCLLFITTFIPCLRWHQLIYFALKRHTFPPALPLQIAAPSLGKFCIMRNKGKPLELVLQGTTRQVQTNNYSL